MAGGPTYAFSGKLGRLIIDEHKKKSLPFLRLEDVSMSLWIERFNNDGIQIKFIDERRFFRQRVCEERAFNFLLEEGRPLEVNVHQTMRELWERKKFNLNPFCLPWTTSEDCMVKGRTRNYDRLVKEGKPRAEVEAAEAQVKAAKADQMKKWGWTEWRSQEDPIKPKLTKKRQKQEDTQRKKMQKEKEKKTTSGTAPLKDRQKEKKPNSKAKTGTGAKGAKVLVYDDLSGFHPFLWRSGKVTCSVPCEYTKDHKDLAKSDMVLFMADKEFYEGKKARALPTKPDTAIFGAVFREALPLYTQRNLKWERYDARISYRRDDFATYSYMDDVTQFLKKARQSYAIPKPPHTKGKDLKEGQISHTAHVSLRCGNTRNPKDGRYVRMQIIDALLEHTHVDSYGVCQNNRPWPEGYRKDKHHVMVQHKFCVAVENNLDRDYTTEKLFDCLRAGAVPLYYGNPGWVRQLLPVVDGHSSVIFIDDYKSKNNMKGLVDLLDRLAENEEDYEKYRAWIKNPPQEWLGRLREIENSALPCRICEAVSKGKKQTKF